MSEKIRILFLEDSAEDFELETRELSKEGLRFVSKRVETVEQFTDALAEFKPNLIISDFTLPKFDGLVALKIAKEVCPDTPFVYVSGTIGEERAVECLHQGAVDYVVKGNLASLGPRVRRALNEAKERADRRSLEQQVFQAQKMEAIGRLAGGVAHDFNNILTAILGFSDLLLQRLPESDPKRQDVREIWDAGKRAEALTRGLLAFSRKQLVQPRAVDLNSLISGLAKMLRRLIGEHIELVTRLSNDAWAILADPGQIEQIIMNLAVNARDAMPEGGRLQVETASVVLDEDFSRANPGVKPGPYVLLTVSDTGHGMDENVKAHLFEPFFTTKELGKGTGLGLSTVYGIVKQYKGHVGVESAPGAGATFRIYLPRTGSADLPAVRTGPEGTPSRGSETLLLVEDDDALRSLAKRVLAAAGYTVLEASEGRGALNLLGSQRGPVHLLLTDIVMPGMSGLKLAEQVVGQRPSVKVLYMTGFADSTTIPLSARTPAADLIQKPFSPGALLEKVRELLDRPAAS